jgi:hypothetical protein
LAQYVETKRRLACPFSPDCDCSSTYALGSKGAKSQRHILSADSLQRGKRDQSQKIPR